MAEYAHGFRLDEGLCDGCLACMRVCPTMAIRVKHGKALVLPELCIDCGSCLKACPQGAFTATTRTLEEFDRFAYKVAIPSPVLFGQFPLDVRPEHIAQGLLAVGFDAVWDYGVEMRLVTRAIVDYVESWRPARDRGARDQAPLLTGTRPCARPDRGHLRDALPGAHDLDHAAGRGRQELP